MTADEYEKLPAADQDHFMLRPDCREMFDLWSSEDVVFTERLDWLVQHDGNRMGPALVVGVTEFRDGKISAWREYFDTSGFAHTLAS